MVGWRQCRRTIIACDSVRGNEEERLKLARHILYLPQQVLPRHDKFFKDDRSIAVCVDAAEEG